MIRRSTKRAVLELGPKSMAVHVGARLATESDLKRAVLAVLARIPRIHVLRMNAGRLKGRVLGEEGTPDVLVMLPGGKALWIELKTEKGKLRPAQEQWHGMARGLEHPVHVVREPQDAINIVREALDCADEACV